MIFRFHVLKIRILKAFDSRGAYVIQHLVVCYVSNDLAVEISRKYVRWSNASKRHFLVDVAIAELLHPTELSSSMESLTAYDASVGSPGPVHQSQRTKRMRTSFKHHQLRTMKNYFAINQNPDAKDLKQLAQKTGLSKRVLQVNNFPFNLHFENGIATKVI